MEASYEPYIPSTRRCAIFLTCIAAMVRNPLDLLAQPAVEDSFFEEGVIEDGKITGSKGNQSFEFIVEYNINVSTGSLGVEDLQVVGTGGAVDGQMMPFTFIRGNISGAKRIASDRTPNFVPSQMRLLPD